MMHSLVLLMMLSFPAVDSDLDGLSDRTEQLLLEQFEPSFFVSTEECDLMPAEFQPGVADPKVISRNGTIYGQAFPVSLSGIPKGSVELHYYHLWNRDCGRAPHNLDPEHVAVLVSPNDVAWQALYWYAAAHEGTICDASNAAQASAIDAEFSGASVWISRGKHGSFLSPDLCTPGCGGDDCTLAQPMPEGKVTNIGELKKPMNGSKWIRSRQWGLAEKMETDFTAQVVEKLNRSMDQARIIQGPVPPFKAIVLTGNSTLTGASTGIRETGYAVGLGTKHGIWNPLVHTGKALFRVFRIFAE